MKLTAAGLRALGRVVGVVTAGVAVRLIWTPVVPSAGLRALCETFILTAAVATFVVVLTIGDAPTVRRLIILCALGALGWLSFAWGVVPVVKGFNDPPELTGWSLVLTRLVLALLFLAAAWVPDIPLRRPKALSVAGGVLVVAMLGGCVVAGAAMPTPLQSPTLGLGATFFHQGMPFFAARVATVLVWAAATVGFATRVGEAACFAPVRRVCACYTVATGYALTMPMLPSEYVTLAVVARVAAATVLFRYAVAALRKRAAVARAEEREALASLLHDTIAQELALMAMLRSAGLPNERELVDAAAERALRETRGAIDALHDDHHRHPVRAAAA